MADSHDSRSRSDSDVAIRKIFIGGLSYGTDDDKLRKYFGAYGSVQDAVVMKDPVSRRSRGFGFITFFDVSSVDNALAHEPHTIDARKVEAKRAVPRSEVPRESSTSTPTSSPKPASSPPIAHSSAKSASSHSSYDANANANANASSGKSQGHGGHGHDNGHGHGGHGHSNHNGSNSIDYSRFSEEDLSYNKIFVGGLHYDTRDVEFRTYFERFGKVASAEVMFNRETHKSRGFGFVIFEKEAGADKVCAQKEHVIDGKVVEVKRAIPRALIQGGGGSFQSTTTTVSGKSINGNNSNSNNSNIRQDIRRSSSVGSAQGLKPTLRPTTATAVAVSNSSNTRGAAATAAATATANSDYHHNHSQGHGHGLPPRPSAPVTSYAAALKVGVVGENNSGIDNTLYSSHGENLREKNNNADAATAAAASFSGINNAAVTSINNNGSAASISSSIHDIWGLPSLPNISFDTSPFDRPPRSYSEPIVQMSPQFFLNNNNSISSSIFEGGGLSSPQERSPFGGSSPGILSSSPGSYAQSYGHTHWNPSGGGSVVGSVGSSQDSHMLGAALGGLHWLSTPPSGPLDSPLPTATAASGDSSNSSTSISGNSNSNSLFPPSLSLPPNTVSGDGNISNVPGVTTSVSLFQQGPAAAGAIAGGSNINSHSNNSSSISIFNSSLAPDNSYTGNSATNFNSTNNNIINNSNSFLHQPQQQYAPPQQHFTQGHPQQQQHQPPSSAVAWAQLVAPQQHYTQGQGPQQHYTQPQYPIIQQQQQSFQQQYPGGGYPHDNYTQGGYPSTGPSVGYTQGYSSFDMNSFPSSLPTQPPQTSNHNSSGSSR